MADVVHAEIVHDHHVPVRVLELIRDVSGNIVVDFGKVLRRSLSHGSRNMVYISYCIHSTCMAQLTETKKLDVPSERLKVFGNSLSQVSSPYMMRLLSGLAFICVSQVSWCERLEDLSDSARFRIMSRNEGIEPVVIALRRGMVTVGAVACAVKGIAWPSRMSLCLRISNVRFHE